MRAVHPGFDSRVELDVPAPRRRPRIDGFQPPSCARGDVGRDLGRARGGVVAGGEAGGGIVEGAGRGALRFDEGADGAEFVRRGREAADERKDAVIAGGAAEGRTVGPVAAQPDGDPRGLDRGGRNATGSIV